MWVHVAGYVSMYIGWVCVCVCVCAYVGVCICVGGYVRMHIGCPFFADWSAMITQLKRHCYMCVQNTTWLCTAMCRESPQTWTSMKETWSWWQRKMKTGGPELWATRPASSPPPTSRRWRFRSVFTASLTSLQPDSYQWWEICVKQCLGAWFGHFNNILIM